MPETNTSIRLIAVYARVSTARQEDENTIETQLFAIRKFAAVKGYTIIQEYTDDGWSGDMLARPALDLLRQDAKKKLWDGVLFYDPDRLARRYSFQELVMDELRDLRIEPLFVTIPPSRNHEDRLLYGVRGVFAEYERIKITERFRLGKVRKANEGHIVGSEGPYGYRLIPRRGRPGDADFMQTHYEIDDLEARIVRSIFGWVADEGLTIRQLVKRLQLEGVRPRKSRRGVWNTSTLGTLLRNRTYIGEAHYGASYAVVPERPLKREGYRRIKKTSRRMRPEEEWIKIPAPALIEPALFDRVQRRLQENFRLARRNRKNQYLLSGKIRCVCGLPRCGEGPQRGRHLYYRCGSRAYNYPLAPTCRERGINARIADALVWEKLIELMSSPELLSAQAERSLRERKEIATASPQPAEVEAQLAKLRAEEDRYAQAYGAGLFGLDQFKGYAAPLRTRIANLEKELARASPVEFISPKLPVPRSDEFHQFAFNAANRLHNLSFEERRAIVSRVISKVVGTQTELVVSGCLQIFEHVEYKPDDRYGAHATRHPANANLSMLPFQFTIELPVSKLSKRQRSVGRHQLLPEWKAVSQYVRQCR